MIRRGRAQVQVQQRKMEMTRNFNENYDSQIQYQSQQIVQHQSHSHADSQQTSIPNNLASLHQLSMMKSNEFEEVMDENMKHHQHLCGTENLLIVVKNS